ncbi:hypothetical protein Tco_0409113 [Tanacetum coccineum]
MITNNNRIEGKKPSGLMLSPQLKIVGILEAFPCVRNAPCITQDLALSSVRLATRKLSKSLDLVQDLLHSHLNQTIETSLSLCPDFDEDVHDYSDDEIKVNMKGKAKVGDEDLSKPFKEVLKCPFTRRIVEFSSPGHRMPSNAKIYDEKGDPEDHMGRFVGMGNQGEWPMPVLVDSNEKKNHWGTGGQRLNAQTDVLWEPAATRAQTYFQGARASCTIRTAAPSQPGVSPTERNQSGLNPGFIGKYSSRDSSHGIPTTPAVTSTIGRSTQREGKKQAIERPKETEPQEKVSLTEQVLVNPAYPEQLVVIGKDLSPEGSMQLKNLLKRNKDIFAWEPADMTGVHMAEEDEEKIAFYTDQERTRWYQGHLMAQLSSQSKGKDRNLDMPYPIFGHGVLTNTPYPFLGYEVLAENVFFLIFDQSIIYGVSMAYSSKSDNGLEFVKVFRYGVLDSLAWAPRIKYSKILTQEIGYAVSDFWIRGIDQYAISVFLDTEY